ncbi:polysaccharide biosynthesis protein [Ammoniphilus sp. CFH 90114]|uniref:putative polysaccharide biosynthesis protein n=1 Tax=Ammoniphilus sp. CFH 90114 TaxID=2493665 RepID=UPI0013E91441|nr:polysaccharide biosynthesis protein [Ammoniphilus sp. CFH 90114]
MSNSSFIRGAIALSAAAFISKLLGLFYVIPLKHFAGDVGLALYQAVFPIYNTLLILSVSGIPIAMSKLISEELANGRTMETIRITRSACLLMIVVAGVGFIGLYQGADILAGWIGNRDTKYSIQALAMAMLLVPFVAVLRGYFYGYQRMKIGAVSQVIEQLVRVSLMIGFVYWLVMEGREMAVVAAGAAWGSFFGLAVSLLFLLIIYLSTREKTRGIKKPSTSWKGEYSWKLIKIAVPVSLSTLMLPLLGMVDSMSIINLLKSSGLSVASSTTEFGLYSRGVPIVQFSAFYATGLAVAVVPALASELSVEAQGRKIYQTLKITFLIGAPASVGMMMIAEPLNVLFYGNSQGSEALIVLAASTFFLSLSITTSGLLQGLGKPIWPAIILLIGIVVKVVGNTLLVPRYGIIGAAYSTLFTYGCISLLCLQAVIRVHARPLIPGKQVGKWLAPSVSMGLIVAIAMAEFIKFVPVMESHRLFSLYEVVTLLIVGFISYGIGLLFFHVITWRQLLDFWQGRVLGRHGKE